MLKGANGHLRKMQDFEIEWIFADSFHGIAEQTWGDFKHNPRCFTRHSILGMAPPTSHWEKQGKEQRAETAAPALNPEPSAHCIPQNIPKAPSAFPHPRNHLCITSSDCNQLSSSGSSASLGCQKHFIAAESKNASCACTRAEQPVHVKQLHNGY